MVCVIALRPLPGLRIDERGHPDRNSFGRGLPYTPLTIASATIFQAPPPLRPSDIPGVRAIVVRFSFTDRVAADLDDTTLCTPAMLGLPG